MLVKDLIEQLQKLPSDMGIYLDLYRGGEFKLEGMYINNAKKEPCWEGQMDFDWFVTHELKNPKYTNKRVIIVRVDDDEED